MRQPTSRTLLLLSALAVGTFARAQNAKTPPHAAKVDEPARSTNALPVTRVSLYKNGVAAQAELNNRNEALNAAKTDLGNLIVALQADESL